MPDVSIPSPRIGPLSCGCCPDISGHAIPAGYEVTLVRWDVGREREWEFTPVPPPPPICEGVGCSRPARDGRRCWSCVVCEHCHVIAPSAVLATDGGYFCEQCARRSFRCDECNRATYGANECANACEPYQDDEEFYFDDDGRPERLINSYSFKPEPVFHGEGTKLFLGPEIEIESSRTSPRLEQAARLAVESLGDLGYLKEDGSISCGFEIVTHPMSYEWAMSSFPWDMLPALSAIGCRAESNNGIHIHLSRAGFDGPTHIYRWMKLIHRNKREVIELAGRESHWAKFEGRDEVVNYAKGSNYADRYQAINVTNRNTFEFRIFSSSLDPDMVKAFFAFAASSVEYARQLTANAIVAFEGWNWSTYTAWVAERPEYAPLTNHLTKGK